MNRLRAGYCLVANPFNPGKVSRVSLASADVEAIVFWTKDPSSFFPCLDEIDHRGFRYYFLFTLNDYPAALEPGLPALDERIDVFRRLAGRIGPARVIWRYDPIILSRNLHPDYHRRAFAAIARELRGSCERVIVSLLDFYRKTERRLRTVEKSIGDAFCRDPFACPGFDALAADLISMAADNGLALQSCAEEERLAELGVPPGKCIDEELIRRAFNIQVTGRKDPGQRGDCLCVCSRDIGATDTCLHDCAYCYATRSPDAARRRFEQHDPAGEQLVPAREGRPMGRAD